jgi:hypothetical protein
MQQPLLHSLLDVQSAWHEPSSLRQICPFGMPDPLWQQSLVPEHELPASPHDGPGGPPQYVAAAQTL